MQTSSMPKAIMAALLVAQKAAVAVAKESRNQHYNYAYASTEAMIEEGKAALIGAGLVLSQLSWTPCGPGEIGSYVNIQYELLCPEGGVGVRWSSRTPVIPEKGRPLDKAQSTALTYSLGYTIRGLLLLPRVEPGTEVDARDTDRPPEPPRREAPAASPEVLGAYAAEVAAATSMEVLSSIYTRITQDGRLSEGQAQALVGACSDRVKALKKSAKKGGAAA